MNRELKPEELEFLEIFKDMDGILPNSNGNKVVGFDFTYNQYFYLNKYKKEDNISYFSDKEGFKKLLQEQLPQYDIDSFFFSCICNKIKGRRIVFNPHQDSLYEEHGDRYFNTFSTSGSLLHLKDYVDRRIGISLERHDISFLKKYPFITTVLKNITNNNMTYVEYFINWLSTALNTLDKNMTAIAFVGETEGTGKGLTEEFLIRKIYGRTLATLSNKDLKSDFDSILDEKMFIVLNEIKADLNDSRNVAEKLKVMITDKHLTVSRKHKDTVVKTNFYNCMLFSNEALPIKVGSEDRRWTIFNTSSVKLIQIAEKLGYTMDEFVENYKKETDAFILDLFLYKYNKQKALKVLSTELKENIAENTSTKLEVVCSKLKKCEYKWFEEKIIEFDDSQMTRNGLRILKEELDQGIISSLSLVFVYNKLIDLETLSSLKISQKFQPYLGKADVIRNSQRYRDLRKGKSDLDQIKDEFVSSFVSETEVLKNNIEGFEVKKDNYISLKLFLDLLDKNLNDRFSHKYCVFSNELEDKTELYFTNQEGNKFVTYHESFLRDEEQKELVEKILKFCIPF